MYKSNTSFLQHIKHIDFLMFFSAFFLALAGLVTMNSFSQNNLFYQNQIIWISISVITFFIFSFVDFRFLRQTNVIMFLFLSTLFLLVLVFIIGDTVKGAQSRFNLGAFAVQPSDPAKVVIIALLAKYFTRRHVEIANFRHIFVSGIYAFIVFALIAMQPDFGSAIMIATTWFGMVLVSGLSKKHLFAVIGLGIITSFFMWSFVFQDYQKTRIATFLHPLADIHGAGYNAYQSTIAVGSGGLFGKGVGYGTQSKMRFLPEYQTDFIFASYAEEWGFIGVILLFILFAILIWRILLISQLGASNFEMLFGVGVVVLFTSHFIIHVGMNIGIMPVTGVTLPFMSYGGSHLLTEFAALGVISGMNRYAHTTHQDDTKREFFGM